MSRIITQLTFDDAVKENIEEFSMTMDEAVDDAIQQFESQGVSLQNIITNSLLTNEVDILTQKIKKVIQTLEENLGDHHELVLLLNNITEECDDGIAKRVLAGQCGLHNVLVNFLMKNEPVKDELKIAIFETLISMMTGYPDLLDENSFNIIEKTLKDSSNETMMILTLKLSVVCCVKHEKNRVKFLDNEEIINSLKDIMQKEIISPDVLNILCKLFQTFVLNDDIRADIPSAHKHACLISTEFLNPLISRLRNTKIEKKVLVAILKALIAIIVRNEFCEIFFEASGLEILRELLLEYSDDEVVSRSCLSLIKVVAGNDHVKAKVFEIIDPSIVIFTVLKFLNSPKACSQGLACFTMLSLRNANNSKLLRENNVTEIIVQAMKIHSSTKTLLKSCCWLMKNLVQGNEKFASDLLNLGVEDSLRDVLKNHEDCTFEANVALRLLGCEVECQKLWTGDCENFSKAKNDS